jgi:hypothetical protein
MDQKLPFVNRPGGKHAGIEYGDGAQFFGGCKYQFGGDRRPLSQKHDWRKCSRTYNEAHMRTGVRIRHYCRDWKPT